MLRVIRAGKAKAAKVLSPDRAIRVGLGRVKVAPARIPMAKVAKPVRHHLTAAAAESQSGRRRDSGGGVGSSQRRALA